jgi:CheY-like chemotaxis protein
MKFRKIIKGGDEKISLMPAVDDSGEIHELFSICLRGEGYPVLEAATGRQGLQLAAQPERNFAGKCPQPTQTRIVAVAVETQTVKP